MNISIEEANISHIPTLVTYWQAIDAFPQAERPFGGDSSDKPQHCAELLKHTLKSPNACVLVAMDNTSIIGTISGHVFKKPAVNINKVGVIYSLWVHESYRCQGIGKQLLDKLEKELKHKGAMAFQVGWDTPNQLASTWWQNRGYCSYEVIASKIV